MKSNTAVIGINLAVLFISILFFETFLADQNSIVYFLPVGLLAVFNIAKSIIYFHRREKIRAKAFILSALLVLIIGGSSCVSIRFRNPDTVRWESTHPKKETHPVDTLRVKHKK